MTERMSFICDYQSGLFSMTELCRRYGISRKTGYKWVERFAREGPSGLEDRSRAPRSGSHRVSDSTADAIVKLREEHPNWGPKKLIKVLRTSKPKEDWPAVSTAGDLLKREGLVTPRRLRQRRPHPGRPKIQTEAPNDLWTVDFKGEFLTRNGQKCFPLTLVDRHSRFILAIESLESTARAGVVPQFEAAFRKYGLPRAILSDNGTPFSSQAILGLSRLSVWWLKLGISPLLIEKGRPDQNGAHERMHRDLKAETARPPAADLVRQQRRFDEFRRIYNEIRPHESLDMKPPAEGYKPSDRVYPEKLDDVEYPAYFQVRRVHDTGQIRWKGDKYFLSECLAGEPVGLEEVDDGIWSIYFASRLLGRLDERTGNIQSGAPRRPNDTEPGG